MDPERTPVVVGVGQALARPAGSDQDDSEGDEPVAPLRLVETAARRALGEAPGIERSVGQVSVVNILNGGGDAPAGVLARRLGLEPRRTETTTIGGNTPQWLVTRAAAGIARGDGPTTLIAGGETVRSQQVRPELGAEADAEAKAADTEAEAKAKAKAKADEVVGDERVGLSGPELAAGLMAPAHVYPLFESVLARRAGHSFAEHREALGALMAPFSRVAARNPFTWFREELDPRSIAEPAPENRLVAEPYTKRMSAFLVVDQAAAVVVTSLATARELGVAEGAVFVHSGADASDVWFLSERPDLGTSPGIRAAAGAALDAADTGVGELRALDLYSCFPCAVEIAAAELGLATDDERGFTVTGGLPYFGGPGNDYTTHAVASMVGELRERGGRGLVSGLGWFMTKHSVGVYGDAPPDGGFEVGDTSARQHEIDASAREVVAEVDDPVAASVGAATVVYDRGGGVQAAPVVATLDDGRRVVAGADRDELDDLAGVELVGARIRVEGGPPRYRVEGVERR